VVVIGMRKFMLMVAAVGLFYQAGLGAETPGYEIWVTNQHFDKIQIIAGKTLTLIKEIALDTDGQDATSKPHMILFSPDYKYAYVAALGANKLVIIDTAEGKIAAEIPTGQSPHAAVPSPDGKRVYVANMGDDTLTEILTDTATGKFELGRTINIRDGPDPEGVKDRPTCLMFTADSKKAYVTNGGDPNAEDPIMTGSISIIDVEKGEELADKRIEPIGKNACGLRLSPDGQSMYVDIGAPVNKLLVIDVNTDKVIKEKAIEQQDPHGIAISADGKYLWIVNRLSNSVTVLEPQTDEVEVISDIGDKPDLAEFTPDGQFLVVTLRGEHPSTGDPHALAGKEAGISVINTATKEVRKMPLPGGDPHGLAIRPVVEKPTLPPLVSGGFPWALLAGLVIALIIALGVTR